ncbi:MAG: PAS domain-containing protein [Caulobacter sp.]|nr:PAS domain-containing protein [Caulobacter sp.]
MSLPKRDDKTPTAETIRLVDENEQLRTLLEAALEENAVLTGDLDRLRDRLAEMGNEMRLQREIAARDEQYIKQIEPTFTRQDETEEKLRVAFEELQVLTEELEVANSGLHRNNQELDARVELRTRQLKEINQALRGAEASLRTVADLVPDLLWRCDGAGQADWFNQRWREYTGLSSVDLAGFGWSQVVREADRESIRAAWNAAVTRNESFEFEHRLRDQTGDYRWFLVRVAPLRGEDGEATAWFAAGTDVHDQRSAMEALQHSELRFRTLIEGMPQLVWRAADAGDWTWASPQWCAYTGQTMEEALGWGWLAAFHTEDRPAAREAWKRAPALGVVEIEGRVFDAAENRHRHFRTRALPVRDARGTVMEWLGTSTDVDDLLQLQERQSILVAELQHRTRNLMAVVHAVTSRTLIDSPSLDHFSNRIEERLSALARVQGLLSQRDSGTRVPFDRLLRAELSAHLDISAKSSEGKIKLSGPADVALRSATVQTFALALHELTTNAVKYGALSQDSGRLEINWGVERRGADQPLLWVDWLETGVSTMPSADAPARGGGYGRELIERALPYQLGADTTYELTPDGVHCMIRVITPA